MPLSWLRLLVPRVVLPSLVLFYSSSSEDAQSRAPGQVTSVLRREVLETIFTNAQVWLVTASLHIHSSSHPPSVTGLFSTAEDQDWGWGTGTVWAGPSKMPQTEKGNVAIRKFMISWI